MAGLAASTRSAILNLRSLCNSLPGRLHAVNNDVADLKLGLTHVVALLKDRAAALGSESLEAIHHLLLQARNKLNEINNKLIAASERSKTPLVGASIWRKEQGRLRAL